MHPWCEQPLERATSYRLFYVDKYEETYPQIKELMHEVSNHVASQDGG